MLPFASGKSDDLPRWLDAEALAAYISVRPDAVARLVKANRIPEPSRLLGPRQPRWDRLAIDALFEGRGSAISNEQILLDRIEARETRSTVKRKP